MNESISPTTGKPVSTIPQISSEDLIKTLTVMRMKLDHISMSNLQLSLYVEYLVEKLSSLTIEGEPALVIDLEEFQVFADARFAEIKNEALMQQAQATVQDAESFLGQSASGLDLNE